MSQEFEVMEGGQHFSSPALERAKAMVNQNGMDLNADIEALYEDPAAPETAAESFKVETDGAKPGFIAGIISAVKGLFGR